MDVWNLELFLQFEIVYVLGAVSSHFIWAMCHALNRSLEPSTLWGKEFLPSVGRFCYIPWI